MTSFRAGVFCVALSVGLTCPLQATAADGDVAKAVLDVSSTNQNLLKPDAWRPWQLGFEREASVFVCNNGSNTDIQRGASQTVVLNQTQPEPIVATASSRAEGVTGTPDSDYALCLDLSFTDGTHLWGQTAPFSTGTHDWQSRRVVVVPDKPIRSLSFHLLLRRHGGAAWFRDPTLQVVAAPDGAFLFDGVPVMPQGKSAEGFLVRDVAAGGPFVRIDDKAFGLKLDVLKTDRHDARLFDVTLSDTTGSDRAVTLVYAIPIKGTRLLWLDDPRSTTPVESSGEYAHTVTFRSVGGGRMSRYPLGGVIADGSGMGLGIDMARPGFFRIAYNAGSGELFLAYDLGLTAEKPEAHVRFCRYRFDAGWGFRSALARYYQLFPDAFLRRVEEQGLWMPFAKISDVVGWQDFGFKFKEGNNETAWDDAHNIVTFRYTEPMTWWMRMPLDMPRTPEAASAEAQRLADAGNRQALAWVTSSYRDADGRTPARLRDTPWCNGAVWSMNSMPGIRGEVTDFKLKWNADLRQKLYGPERTADLDGEYVDSSEGYVTDELDFRRDHFAAADTPLVFSSQDHRPAIFRGLVAFEYVRTIADDVHGMGKLMMANSTPSRLPWLAPMLDVAGTETNWNLGRWRPMSDAELLYRRAMCGTKPFCFLMNTRFEDFSHELVERYMKRSLAYGMFPGFFSHNASQGHYFTRPELYDRDRPLFKKYVPLCKLVAEAGWQPIPLARSSDERVYVERFGDRYLTVFNDSDGRRSVTITLQSPPSTSSRELVTGKPIAWQGNETVVSLEPEDVAVIDLESHP